MERRRGRASKLDRSGRPAAPPHAVSAEWLGERLSDPARELGVELSGASIAPLARFAGLVLDWGTRVNLTGARSREAIADDHFADALALLPHLPRHAFRFVDVGSGAGFPGLLIALLRPDASGVLLEPTRKKQAFLVRAIRELGLGERIEARAERLEEHLARGAVALYDLAVSRAAWPASRWVEVGMPLLRAGGVILGVEGAQSGALPAGAERHPYRLHGRSRSVVSRRR